MMTKKEDQNSSNADTEDALGSSPIAKSNTNRILKRWWTLPLKNDKNPLSTRRRFLLLYSMLVLITLLSVSIMTIMLYRHQIAEQKIRLTEIVKSQSQLFEAIAHHVKIDSLKGEDPNFDPFEAAMIQITGAHRKYELSGQTVEITLAQLQGDSIVFLLRHRYGSKVQQESIPMASVWAEPQRRALTGQSGTTTGYDYRGEEVLAAYEPVKVLGLGIVAKIDLAEIRTPFIKAAVMGGIIAAILLLLGTLIFVWITSPVVRRLENHTKQLLRELTERKHAESALRESEEKFRALYDNAPLSYQSLNEDGSFRDVNPTWLTTLGYKKEEVIGKLYSDFLHPDWKPKFEKGFPEFKKRGYVHDIEFRIRHKKGHYLDIQFEGCIGYNPDGSFKQTYCVFQDITERMKTEEDLKESEQRFAVLSQATHEGIGISHKGMVIDVNEQLAQILGYTRSELIGQPASIFVAPESQKLVEQHIRSMNAEPYEHKALKKDGSIIDVEAHGQELPYAGEMMRVTAINDITERNLAEAALQQSEEQFKRAVTDSPVPIMIHDEDDNILLLSRGWTESSGYTIQEIPTLTEWTKKAYGSGSGTEKKYIDELFGLNETADNGEWKVTAKDGSTRIWDFKTTPLGRNTKGRRLLHSMAFDITERQEAEKVLLQEKLFSEELVSSLPGVFYLISEEGKFLRWNTNFEAVTGRSREELAQISPVDLFEGDDKQVIASAIKRVFTHGQYQAEAKIVAKDGTRTSYQFSGKKIMVDGEPSLIGLGMDITERKQAEQERQALEAQLRQSQKLEAVGTMAGGIAHDFNNILQGLYLSSTIIKDQLPDDAELQTNFQDILDSGERAKELVKQILTFSRKEEFELKPVRIQYLIKDALKLTRASTPSSIEITEDIDADCGAVLCNGTQIHQVIINLCNNAIHAITSKNGRLSVSLQKTDTQIEIEPGNSILNKHGVVELMVSDTGRGMAAETLEHIFDPFFTTKEVGEGTGLGLSIVHGIIKDMQGQIKVESTPGKGTTFRILMPVSAEKEQPLGSEIQPKQAEKKLNILFVDDDELISGAGKLILEQNGHRVTVANNGHEALELFQKDIQAFDLVITDLTMPKMTGLELGKALRFLSQDVLLLLTSGNLDVQLQSEYESLGFNGFIRKPWTASEMLNALNALNLDSSDNEK